MKRTERREQKQAARQRIYHLQAKLRKEPQRVPERVVNGSHQVAVKWKDDAARIPGLPHVIAPPPGSHVAEQAAGAGSAPAARA